MAQGANSSLEDAAALGGLLGKVVSSGESLHRALALFDKIRRERIERLVAETFAQAKEHHLPDGPEQARRDELLAKSFESSQKGQWYESKID